MAASSSTPDSRHDDSAEPVATVEDVMDLDPADDDNVDDHSDDNGSDGEADDDEPEDGGDPRASGSGSPDEVAGSGQTSPTLVSSSSDPRIRQKQVDEHDPEGKALYANIYDDPPPDW